MDQRAQFSPAVLRSLGFADVWDVAVPTPAPEPPPEPLPERVVGEVLLRVWTVD